MYDKMENADRTPRHTPRQPLKRAVHMHEHKENWNEREHASLRPTLPPLKSAKVKSLSV